MLETGIEIPTRISNEISVAAAAARSSRSASLSNREQRQRIIAIRAMLTQQNAVLVAHYYVDPQLQELAEVSGGKVADSLEMARFGFEHSATTVVVAGVRFMGETAKILSPQKRVLLVEPEATCSLDLGCPENHFGAFCDTHPDRTVVVYANTSAAVKARADWVVTSSIAVDLIRELASRGEKVIWAPDRFLGDYVRRETGADMLLWKGSCVVHEEFKAETLQNLQQQYPQSKVLVHPESPAPVIALADVVGSTSQLIAAARSLDAPMYIVATEEGIFHKMQQAVPGKKLVPAPTAGEGATCESCAQCPWMKMNSLARLEQVLQPGNEEEVIIPESIRVRAVRPIQRMLEFAHSR